MIITLAALVGIGDCLAVSRCTSTVGTSTDKKQISPACNPDSPSPCHAPTLTLATREVASTHPKQHVNDAQAISSRDSPDTSCWGAIDPPFPIHQANQAGIKFCQGISGFPFGKDTNTHVQTIDNMVFEVQWHEGPLKTFTLDEKTCAYRVRDVLHKCNKDFKLGQDGSVSWDQLKLTIGHLPSPSARALSAGEARAERRQESLAILAATGQLASVDFATVRSPPVVGANVASSAQSLTVAPSGTAPTSTFAGTGAPSDGLQTTTSGASGWTWQNGPSATITALTTATSSLTVLTTDIIVNNAQPAAFAGVMISITQDSSSPYATEPSRLLRSTSDGISYNPACNTYIRNVTHQIGAILLSDGPAQRFCNEVAKYQFLTTADHRVEYNGVVSGTNWTFTAWWWASPDAPATATSITSQDCFQALNYMFVSCQPHDEGGTIWLKTGWQLRVLPRAGCICNKGSAKTLIEDTVSVGQKFCAISTIDVGRSWHYMSLPGDSTNSITFDYTTPFPSLEEGLAENVAACSRYIAEILSRCPNDGFYGGELYYGYTSFAMKIEQHVPEGNKLRRQTIEAPINADSAASYLLSAPLQKITEGNETITCAWRGRSASKDDLNRAILQYCNKWGPLLNKTSGPNTEITLITAGALNVTASWFTADSVWWSHPCTYYRDLIVKRCAGFGGTVDAYSAVEGYVHFSVLPMTGVVAKRLSIAVNVTRPKVRDQTIAGVPVSTAIPPASFQPDQSAFKGIACGEAGHHVSESEIKDAIRLICKVNFPWLEGTSDRKTEIIGRLTVTTSWYTLSNKPQSRPCAYYPGLILQNCGGLGGIVETEDADGGHVLFSILPTTGALAKRATVSAKAIELGTRGQARTRSPSRPGTASTFTPRDPTADGRATCTMTSPGVPRVQFLIHGQKFCQHPDKAQSYPIPAVLGLGGYFNFRILMDNASPMLGIDQCNSAVELLSEQCKSASGNETSGGHVCGHDHGGYTLNMTLTYQPLYTVDNTTTLLSKGGASLLSGNDTFRGAFAACASDGPSIASSLLIPASKRFCQQLPNTNNYYQLPDGQTIAFELKMYKDDAGTVLSEAVCNEAVEWWLKHCQGGAEGLVTVSVGAGVWSLDQGGYHLSMTLRR